MRRYLFLTLALVVAALVGGSLGLVVLPRVRAAEATFTLQNGEAAWFSAGGARSALQPGTATLLGMGDQLDLNGTGQLSLAMAQITLGRETRLTLRRHNWLPLTGWEVELYLESGQISGRAALPPETQFVITSRAGEVALATGDSEFFAYANADGLFQVGLRSGTAIARATNNRGQSVQVSAGQGTTLRPGQPAAAAAAWSAVRSALYQADGRPADAPLSLVNMTEGGRYWLRPGQYGLVPGGTYELQADLLTLYRAPYLSLATGRMNQLPITLSEVVFDLVDTAGVSIPDAELIVRSGDTTRSVRSGQPVLISPGKWKLQVSRAAAPDLLFLADVALSPGQRQSVRMRTDLFGGGTPQIQVLNPNEQPAKPVEVYVFQSGKEAEKPLAQFWMNDTPPLLPEGTYVISVRTSVAARFEVRIQGGRQNKPIIVRQGTLQVDFRRANGQITTRNVYVANAEIMAKYKVEDPRALRDLPGASAYVIAVETGQEVMLPVGEYNVLVDDTVDVREDMVNITAGKKTALDLKGAQ